VAFNIKIVRLQELRYIIIGFGVDEHRPDDGFFSLTAVRYHYGSW
jgi:hypothetical protein